MYFRVCPHCGCALDPSERCDCQQERRSKQEQEERRAQNGKVHVYGAGQHSISASSKGAKVSGTVNHMLHAGAKIAREEMQAALKEYKIRDTGDLIKSIKASKIKKGDSGKYITIRPTGYDRHGVPNALKGYVYEIGTSRLPARPWKTLADVRMRDKIQARMREVFQEEMSKNGGNEGKWNVEEMETEE